MHLILNVTQVHYTSTTITIITIKHHKIKNPTYKTFQNFPQKNPKFSSQFIFHPQILSNISLVEHHNPIGVQFPTILSTLRRHTKP